MHFSFVKRKIEKNIKLLKMKMDDLEGLRQQIMHFGCADGTQSQGKLGLLESRRTLHDFAYHIPQKQISPSQKFELALILARAVLQFRATPWLAEKRRISQLQVMPFGSETSATTSDVPAMGSLETTLTDARDMGVKSMPLFCLGVVLIEIGHWKTVAELSIDECDKNIVETVGRLATRSARLGKNYDQIVRKCLSRSFGEEFDLRPDALLMAIYEDVVCPLEELVAILDG